MPLADRKINLSKIESRPSKKRPWDYYFFLDVTGHYEDPLMKAALAELKTVLPAGEMAGKLSGGQLGAGRAGPVRPGLRRPGNITDGPGAPGTMRPTSIYRKFV